tara:strand:+ start:1138 stop:1494 length:357 start_codon:yes stop_codon:yes gene_type:complete
MAYMNQEKKKIIASALKEVMPKDWKYSLSVEHHSVIHLNIKSAPFDLTHGKDDVQINHFHLQNHYDGQALEILKKAHDAMLSADWYDDSDSMTDYFNTAYYIRMNVGSWNKPFINTAA